MSVGLIVPRGLAERARRWTEPGPITAAAWVFALGVAALLLRMVLRHWGARHGITHVHGAWLGLAQRALEGHWYPAPFDGQTFAGTRFMPLNVAVLAAAWALLADPYVATKAAALLMMVVLLAQVARALHRAGVPWAHALSLVMLIPLSTPGIDGLGAFRGDVLPVILQLAAVHLVARESTSPRHYAGAGLLAALAVLSKLSAGWAGLAVGLVSLREPRRAFAPFAVTALLTLAAGFVGVELLSDGRFSQNILGLAGSGLARHAGSTGGVIGKFQYLWVESSLVSWALMPVVIYELRHAIVVRNRLDVEQVAFVIALGLTMFILADAGTFANHLLDLVVLTVLLAGRALGRELAEPGPRRVPVVLAVTVVLAGLAGFNHSIAPELRAPVSAARDPLAEVLRGAGPYLCEDATIPIVRGERPLVTDAWIFLRWAARHPEAEAHLIGRIARRELTHVVLLRDPSDDYSREWYSVQSLSPPVIAAVQQHYVQSTVVEGYHVFVPRTEADP